jgi:23S rRNA (uracil1939-C5)-methyltransferase
VPKCLIDQSTNNQSPNNQLPTFDLTLTSHAYGGESLGRLPDGRLVFVPYALPGERVRLRLVEEKRRHARAALLEVLEPSPQRAQPFCAHYGACGGCHYQHLTYPAQVQAKTAILREQLERIGGIPGPAIHAVFPSPDPTHYRNHVQFHLSPEGRLGFQRPRSNQVLPIHECHLPEATLDAIWPQLDFEPIPGLERVGLRLGAEDQVQLILEGDDPQPPEFRVEDLPLSAVYLGPGDAQVLAGGEALIMEVLGRPFRVSAGAFFQVNTPVASLMVEYLLGELPRYHPLGPSTILVDAYCGVGLFSAFLAPRVGLLIGIEASPAAADDFVANLDEFDNVSLYEAPVEKALPALERKPEVILLDPPRSGIGPQAMQSLLLHSAPLVVYVSCDPATLGRDARQLSSGGYRLAQVALFDQFPQTYHIESLSFWVKE